MDRRGLFRAGAAGLALAPVAGVAAIGPALAADPQPAGFAPVVAKLLPTVVSVYIRAVVQKTAANTTNKTTQFASQQSQGSGFIIDRTGYIVTNHHVVQNAYAITIVMEDQREFRARLVATGERIDLALLKIEASKPLPAVSFANSDLVKPGDAVLAVGNPLGLGGTVTGGIVSALNRNISETPFDDFIQIDAAINHGNSGGPLFNAAGELIGVNTAFFSPNGSAGSVGLGFAIPSNDVAWVIDRLRGGHRINPGWIDMEVQSVSSEIATAFGLGAPGGAIIVSLKPDSIAAKAGLRAGDIVTSYNNLAVPDVRALAREVAKTAPGVTASLAIWRNAQAATVPVPVVAWHGTGAINGIPPATHDAELAKAMQAPHYGLTLEMLTPALRSDWGMAANQRGVLIKTVLPFSVADNHNLRPGEVIMNVMDTPTNHPNDVQRLIGALHDKGAAYAALLIGNDNGMRWVSLPIAAGVP
jgi:serine protease Do